MAFTYKLSLAVLGLLALLACTSASQILTPNVAAGTKDQSVVIGAIGYNDRLLLQETAYKESMWMIVRDADIVYPKKNEIGYTITCIKVLDQRKDGKNGEIKVKHGGLGAREVLLRFHSQRGHGLNYVVQIYGH